jgi:hypothetical protein
MLFDIGEPCSNVCTSLVTTSIEPMSWHQLTFERAFIGNIVDQQNPHGTSIVSRGDGSESFLAGSVPYLQLHPLSIKLNGSDLEVDANSGNEGWSK